MDKIEVKRTAYVFSDTERTKLIHVLDYAYHRLVEHVNCGLLKTHVDKSFVNYMRCSLKEPND